MPPARKIWACFDTARWLEIRETRPAVHARHFDAEQKDIDLDGGRQREGPFAGLRLEDFVVLRRQNLPQCSSGGGVIVGDKDRAFH